MGDIAGRLHNGLPSCSVVVVYFVFVFVFFNGTKLIFLKKERGKERQGERKTHDHHFKNFKIFYLFLKDVLNITS